jgi:hypothetical protein
MPIVTVDPFAPTMVETKVETTVTSSTFNTDYFSTTTPHNVELPSEVVEETSTLRFELSTEITAEVVAPKFNIQEENTVTASNDNNQQDENTVEPVASNNSFLTRPSNIYAEPNYEKPVSMSGHLMETPLASQPIEEQPSLK